MDMKFETVEVPEVIVEKKPNPYEPTLKEMLKDKKARSFNLPNASADDGKAIQSAVNQLQKGARSLNRTARKKITDNKNGTATITFWLVDAIKRTPTTDVATS